MESSQQDNHGSLAIDRNQGSRYGWAVDYADQGEADRRALSACQKLGGQCTVVMRFRNACAAYAADQATSSTAYGWAWSERDRATAERTARGECVKRGGVRSQCAIRVWGCTTRGAQVEDRQKRSESVSFEVGQRFRDCPECPEMVVVPAGSFRMGSPPDEQGRYYIEGPMHRVTFGAPFAVGRHEVTFAEWDACVAAGGCGHRPGDNGWGRGVRPVVNVSWDDAKRYAQWLSRKTRKEYRLPSEAEWEYAARAGTATAYTWGDQIGVNRANCRGCGSRWDGSKTAPVGSFRANAWGLHDMHGNVLERTEDCWNDSYRGAPSDGSAWLRGDCSMRVLRGGSWSNGPSGLRAALRSRDSTGDRYSNGGFRVARTLTP